MSTLDQQLLAAHEAKNTTALVDLYTKAADQSDDIDAASFYLTHAYVFALEQGSPAATDLRTRLVANNREQAAD